MNYLAHLYLSGNDPELIAGNFIADGIRGNQIAIYPSGIIKGIKLHRFIDSYTDTHPVVEKSKARLRPEYRKYAGVIVDIYYDHFLAVNWNNFSEVPLNEYLEYIYNLLWKHYPIFPVKMKAVLPRMINQNWLLNYKEEEGIKFALLGLSRRSSFPSKMELASKDLRKHYAAFEEEFSIFFPLLMENVACFIKRGR